MKSEFDKDKVTRRKKEERRKKYDKIIKETNLPLDMERKALRQQISHEKLLKRNTSKQSLKSVKRQVNISPE